MKYDSFDTMPETSGEVSTICVHRRFTAAEISDELPVAGGARETFDKIMTSGNGDRFVRALSELYTDGIDYDELCRVLESGDEAFELCGLNPDGSPATWDGENDDDAPTDDGLDEGVELLTTEGFDRMAGGFPTVVYTVNEDDPDWEEKFQEAQNLVYEVARDLECYDVHLEGGFHSPEGWEEVQLVVDKNYDCDDEEDGNCGCDEEKGIITDLIDKLVQRYGFRKFDFDNYEVDTAVRPKGIIRTFDGDVNGLRHELANTHDFEEPGEIADYLRDNGFNVVDTDGGNGFEAWYIDPSNSEASYMKFRTSQCWDDTYGPCCRLNESTFRIVHPRKVKRQ